MARKDIHQGSHGFNIITGAATSTGPSVSTPTSNRKPLPTSVPRASDPSFREDDFFVYMNNRDSAGATLSQTDNQPKSERKVLTPASNDFNMGRKRMMEQTYSKRWDPKHPGAERPLSTTAKDYAPHTRAGPAKPTLNRQDDLATTMVMDHPLPTSKEKAAFTEPPQRVCPSLAEAKSVGTAGNKRERLSQHWTREFDNSLRGYEKKEKASEPSPKPVYFVPAPIAVHPVYVPVMPMPYTYAPPSPVVPAWVPPLVSDSPVRNSSNADGVLSSLRQQLLKISENRAR